MSKGFAQTPHPLLPMVDARRVLAVAEKTGKPPETVFAELVTAREQAIRNEQENPYEYAMEPPMWNLIRAMMGRTLRMTLELKDAMARLCLDLEGIAEGLRAAVGMSHPATTVLALGGNRSGKTTLEMRLFMETLREQAKAIAWAFHSNIEQSRTYHQALAFGLLPAHLRSRDLKTKREYIAYKVKQGFAEESFVLPNLARGVFKSYEMDRSRAIEGGNIEFAAADELVPSDWIETLELRAAEKNGRIMVGFTPLEGYSDTVRMFLDGATWTRTCAGRAVPRDGGDPDIAGDLRLTDEEYAAYSAWVENPKKAPFPKVFTRWTDVYGWIGTPPDKPTKETVEETRPQGAAAKTARKWMTVPIVAKSADPEERRMVVWFHSRENPWGNPLGVWKLIARMSAEDRCRRFYGLASKSYAVVAAKFNRGVHVLPEGAMPKEGTDYLLIDPCGSRNWAMAWVRCTRDGIYFVEEWPSQIYEVPGYGVLGAWAVPDGKKKDGRPGPAQKTLGWGVLSYKAEVARVEGWKCWKEGWTNEEVKGWERGGNGEGEESSHRGTEDTEKRGREEGGSHRGTESTEKRGREEGGSHRGTESTEKRGEEESSHRGTDSTEKRGRRLRVWREYVDARYAATPTQGDVGLRTLLDELHDVGWWVEAATTTAAVDGRQAITEGTGLINTALDYDQNRPLGFDNRPRLYFSDRCKNLIYAMENHTGEDGQKGATKDFFDLIRMALLVECCYVGEEDKGLTCIGGGSY